MDSDNNSNDGRPLGGGGGLAQSGGAMDSGRPMMKHSMDNGGDAMMSNGSPNDSAAVGTAAPPNTSVVDGGGAAIPLKPVFLGNLNMGYGADDISDLFQRPMILPTNNPSDPYVPIHVDRIDLKRGYCFVFLKDVHSQHERDLCERFVLDINGMQIPNVSSALRAEFARGDGRIKRKEEERRKDIRPSETLFVVNFHEETTKKDDLQMLFSPYGELIRIDMKGNYAFVQFRSIEEAMRAKEATNGGKLDRSVLTVEYVARQRGEGGGRGGRDMDDRRIRDRSRDRQRDRDRFDDRGGGRDRYRDDRFDRDRGGGRDRYDDRRGGFLERDVLVPRGGPPGGPPLDDYGSSRYDDRRDRHREDRGFREDRYDDRYRRARSPPPPPVGGLGARFRTRSRSRSISPPRRRFSRSPPRGGRYDDRDLRGAPVVVGGGSGGRLDDYRDGGGRGGPGAPLGGGRMDDLRGGGGGGFVGEPRGGFVGPDTKGGVGGPGFVPADSVRRGSSSPAPYRERSMDRDFHRGVGDRDRGYRP